MQTIQSRLKHLRRRLQLTQAQMASRLGVSHSLYSKLEVGCYALRQCHIQALCNHFAVSESWLLEGKGTLPEKFPVSGTLAGRRLPTCRQLETIIRCVRNESCLRLAEEIAESTGVSFSRALAIIAQGKLSRTAKNTQA